MTFRGGHCINMLTEVNKSIALVTMSNLKQVKHIFSIYLKAQKKPYILYKRLSISITYMKWFHSVIKVSFSFVLQCLCEYKLWEPMEKNSVNTLNTLHETQLSLVRDYIYRPCHNKVLDVIEAISRYFNHRQNSVTWQEKFGPRRFQ